MADREWRRDPDDYRGRSEFLHDRDYDRRTYDDRYDTRYNDPDTHYNDRDARRYEDPYDTRYDNRSYSGRDYDTRRYRGYGERGSEEHGVTDRIKEWWHRNVSDPDDRREEHRYDRDYSHGPISAGHGGWVRDREWEDRARTYDTGDTDRDWRTDNYTRTTGASTYGTAGVYGGALYTGEKAERGRYAGRGPRSWRRSDDRIREDVNEELTRHPDVDASEVEVAVINAEVTLSGKVDGRHEKREAEECAWRVSGVKDVHNQLKIKQGVGSVIASVFDTDRR